MFVMHEHLPGPEGGVENRGRRPRFSTPPGELVNINALKNHFDRYYCIKN